MGYLGYTLAGGIENESATAISRTVEQVGNGITAGLFYPDRRFYPRGTSGRSIFILGVLIAGRAVTCRCGSGGPVCRVLRNGIRIDTFEGDSFLVLDRVGVPFRGIGDFIYYRFIRRTE